MTDPVPSTNPPAILTRSLSRSFGDIHAVDALDIKVERGELFGIVGPDGAGKTTLMRLLTGVLTPSAGEAWVDGYSINSEAERIKECIGYMSQRFGLYEDLTVRENIEFYTELYEVPPRERPARMQELLEFSGLGPFTSRRAGALSGGMKQKLGLTCALVHRPSIVFLDEPTSGVDPVSRRGFWGILYGLLKEGITVVVTTSYMDEAERMSRVAMMHSGRLLMTEEPQSMRDALGLVMYEVWHEEPRAVLTALTGAPGIRAANAYGETVHVALEAGMQEADLHERLKALGSTTQGLRGMRKVSPSLEDVFIELVGRAS